MECLWCKAFYESKDIKAWEKRKCFICGRELEKPNYVKEFWDMFGGWLWDKWEDLFNQMFWGWFKK